MYLPGSAIAATRIAFQVTHGLFVRHTARRAHLGSHILRRAVTGAEVQIGADRGIALPALSLPILALMLGGYVILTQVVKTWFYRKFGA